MRAQQPALTPRSRITIWCPAFGTSWLLAKLGILTHTVYANSLFSKGTILQDVRCPRRVRLQIGHHALPLGAIADVNRLALKIPGRTILVGIELRRASCRWRVTKPALSIASWVLVVAIPLARRFHLSVLTPSELAPKRLAPPAPPDDSCAQIQRALAGSSHKKRLPPLLSVQDFLPKPFPSADGCRTMEVEAGSFSPARGEDCSGIPLLTLQTHATWRPSPHNPA